MDHKYKLTQLSSSGGCAAKVPADILSRLLKGMPSNKGDNATKLLVGNNTNDDAAVYKINNEQAIIETVDFFPPVVDDPYIFGQIAAANALSDVYAMGGIPILAVNLLTFPCSLDEECVSLILKGGADKVIESGAVIGGGHSITDKEPKYGLAVTGIVAPDKIWTNSNAKVGDVLVFTKKLGVGIYSVAMRADLLSGEDENVVVEQMTRLNKNAAMIGLQYNVNACTDVTGFGLICHGAEMAKGSDVTIKFYVDKLPLFDRAIEFAKMGIIPAGAYGNRRMMESVSVYIEDNIPTEYEDIMLDPQTSGGLLLSMPYEDALEYVHKMEEVGEEAYIIGEVCVKCDNFVEVYSHKVEN